MRSSPHRPAPRVRTRRPARPLPEPLERRVLLSVVYVDDTAPGPTRDGATWATAYTDLQQALDAAASPGPDEIHVAAGTYRPTARTDAADPRSATFSLQSGVGLLGGYPDGGGADRDPAVNVTTLSGDIGTRGTPADNTYHVVTAVGVNGTTVLDGFTVTDGNANGDLPESRRMGGGMYNEGSWPVLTNLTFRANNGTWGGAMHNAGGSSPTLSDCVFEGNSAGYGGGMHNTGGSSPALTNCTFSRNTTSGDGTGGAIANWDSSPTLTNCTFSRNSASQLGGAMFNGPDTSPLLVNCTFSGNSSGIAGGAMVNDYASPRLTNSAFSGNRATIGGAIFNYERSFPSLTNCTLSGNIATNGRGGGMWSAEGSQVVTNSIVWGNNGSQIGNDEGHTNARHSVIQGGWDGQGNLDADPLFVRNPSPGRDGQWGTADDDYGDLRLRAASPAVDAGDSAALPTFVTTDRDGLPRVRGGAVDAGAYEFQERYEAEQAALVGAVVSSSHGGYLGTGFVDYRNASGDSVEFTVYTHSAGRYDLTFRYANGGDTARATGLWVNGAAAAGGLSFAPTGSWGTWGDVTTTVPLNAGANRVRVLATGQSGPNLDSLALRSSVPPASVTYQAESATVSGPTVLSNHAGFTGSGFADFQRTSGDYVEFPIEVPADGNYLLAFRYANGYSSDRPLELRVDGEIITGRLAFSPTGTWATWDTSSHPVLLRAGRHAVRVASNGSNGPNLDSLTVTARATPPDAEPVTLQAEDAALSGVIVARSHAGYTGTGFADYQRATGDSVEFTYDAPAVGDYVLTFRYANGGSSDRPRDLRVNGAVARRSLSFAPTRSWDVWGIVSATVALPSGVNRIRLTSSGSSGPNLDSLTVRPAKPAQDVVYLSQARSVSAWLQESYWWTDPDYWWEDPVLIERDDAESDSAADFGEFQERASVYFGDPDRTGSYITGTQHSQLSDGGIEVSGELEGGFGHRDEMVTAGYSFDSDLDVTFQLDRPRDYRITYSITGVGPDLSLSDIGGATVFEAPPDATTGTRAGRLAPGQYRFVFHYGVSDDDEGIPVGHYAVRLALNG